MTLMTVIRIHNFLSLEITVDPFFIVQNIRWKVYSFNLSRRRLSIFEDLKKLIKLEIQNPVNKLFLKIKNQCNHNRKNLDVSSVLLQNLIKNNNKNFSEPSKSKI